MFHRLFLFQAIYPRLCLQVNSKLYHIQMPVLFGDLNIRVITDTILTSDSEQFHGVNALEAYENDVCVFTKTRSFSIPRDHV
jgi:hypothetical protein